MSHQINSEDLLKVHTRVVLASSTEDKKQLVLEISKRCPQGRFVVEAMVNGQPKEYEFIGGQALDYAILRYNAV